MADRLNDHLHYIETLLADGPVDPVPPDVADALNWHLLKIEELISGGGGGGSINVVVLDELPDVGESSTIYLIPGQSQTETENIYDEYIWVDTEQIFERLGPTNKQDKLINTVNIKSINGESILGSGNLAVKNYHSFNNTWIVNSTTANFCETIKDDTTAVAGMTYLGKLTCSDLPGGLVQGECVVEIISNDASNGKNIHLVLTSADTKPYRWEYSYVKINGSYTSKGWIGYQIEITSTNKLSSDLVTDVGKTNLFVTSSEKSDWNSKAADDAVVHLTGAETITGTKTFTENQLLNNARYLKGKGTNNTEYNLIGINSSNNVSIGNNNIELILGANNNVRPNSDGTKNLGSSDYQWNNIYVSGNLTDGSNSINISNIVNKATKTAGKIYTLLANSWVSNAQTLVIDGKTSNNNAQVSIPQTWLISSNPDVYATIQQARDNKDAIDDAVIFPIIDNGTSLTFNCETTPIIDLKIYVEVYE